MTGSEAATGRLNLLVAYPYVTSDVLALVRELGPHVRWTLDSGAYTAWKSGTPIELDDYCKFLEALPVKPWRYFTLDVLGEPEGTLRNYETMLARGFKPVPIYTRGSDPKMLDHYYQTSDVVGLGGLVDTRASTREVYVHAMIKRNAGRRVHLLGFTSLKHLKALRPYMCDSSNWEGAARYGGADVYMGYGKFARLTKNDVRAKPPQDILDRLFSMGFKPSELGTRANWHGGKSVSRRISAASWIAASIDIERNIGTKLFIAASVAGAVRIVCEQYMNMKRLPLQPMQKEVEAA